MLNNFSREALEKAIAELEAKEGEYLRLAYKARQQKEGFIVMLYDLDRYEKDKKDSFFSSVMSNLKSRTAKSSLLPSQPQDGEWLAKELDEDLDEDPGETEANTIIVESICLEILSHRHELQELTTFSTEYVTKLINEDRWENSKEYIEYVLANEIDEVELVNENLRTWRWNKPIAIPSNTTKGGEQITRNALDSRKPKADGGQPRFTEASVPPCLEKAGNEPTLASSSQFIDLNFQDNNSKTNDFFKDEDAFLKITSKAAERHEAIRRVFERHRDRIWNAALMCEALYGTNRFKSFSKTTKYKLKHNIGNDLCEGLRERRLSKKPINWERIKPGLYQFKNFHAANT